MAVDPSSAEKDTVNALADRAIPFLHNAPFGTMVQLEGADPLATAAQSSGDQERSATTAARLPDTSVAAAQSPVSFDFGTRPSRRCASKPVNYDDGYVDSSLSGLPEHSGGDSDFEDAISRRPVRSHSGKTSGSGKAIGQGNSSGPGTQYHSGSAGLSSKHNNTTMEDGTLPPHPRTKQGKASGSAAAKRKRSAGSKGTRKSGGSKIKLAQVSAASASPDTTTDTDTAQPASPAAGACKGAKSPAAPAEADAAQQPPTALSAGKDAGPLAATEAQQLPVELPAYHHADHRLAAEAPAEGNTAAASPASAAPAAAEAAAEQPSTQECSPAAPEDAMGPVQQQVAPPSPVAGASAETAAQERKRKRELTMSVPKRDTAGKSAEAQGAGAVSAALRSQLQQEQPRTKQKQRSGKQRRKSAAQQAAAAKVAELTMSPGDTKDMLAATPTAAAAKPAGVNIAKPTPLRRPLHARALPPKGRPLVRLTPAAANKAPTVRAAKPLLGNSQESSDSGSQQAAAEKKASGSSSKGGMSWLDGRLPRFKLPGLRFGKNMKPLHPHLHKRAEG